MTRLAASATRQWLRAHADVLFVLLAALLATLPLLVRGASCGHDLSFHLQNWQEVATQWTHGTLRPFWAFHPAWHAGEPRFVFYPPLSWMLGALLGLILPWTATPVAFTFVVLLLCGCTARTLLRRFVPPAFATAGACLYLANPYMLFVAYERSAYAELLAAAWMPLLLLAVLERHVHVRRLAVAVALLWLTNAPAAIVGSYSLLLLAGVRLLHEAWRTRAFAVVARQAARLITGTLLGLALAGFFLVPALAERRFVTLTMAIVPGLRPADSFLFGHTESSFHDAVLRSASWIAVGILAAAFAAAAALLLNARRHRSFRSMSSRAAAQHLRGHADAHTAVIACTVLSLAVLFLLTRYSAAVWRVAPQLVFLQFPWRFLSIEAAVAVLLLTLVAASLVPSSRRTGKTVIAAALLWAALVPWAAHVQYAQPCDEEDIPAAQRALYATDQGTEPTDEYTPANADNDALHPNLPAAWLTTTNDGPPDAATMADVIATDDGDPAHLRFDIRDATAPRTLVVRLRSFPGWALQVDGAPRSIESIRNDGLVTVDLPPGAHTVELSPRWTADRLLGILLSVLALGLLLFAFPAPGNVSSMAPRSMEGRSTHPVESTSKAL